MNNVQQINKAEVEVWRKHNHIKRIDWSDEILKYDCGGKQLVLEICIPATKDKEDIIFMKDILNMIEKYNIPAHSAIEQRFSCGSRSILSPAHGTINDSFSWIGIIMYLPDKINKNMHQAITKEFKEYSNKLLDLGKAKQARVHWGKLELPENKFDQFKQPTKEVIELRNYIKSVYNIQSYNSMRHQFDPENILTNTWLTTIFGDKKQSRLQQFFSKKAEK